MDIVLGVSLAPNAVRLVLVEGQDADGVTVEQDEFALSATDSGPGGVIDAIVGTREGAAEGGYRLAATGVTWTDPAESGALRDAIASHDVGSVMLVSPLLAAAALAQAIGLSIGYKHIALLFVESDSATLAVVDVADGSIVDLHRRQLLGGTAAELAAMVAGLDAPTSRADGVFVVGSGVGRGGDIVAIKTALEAATGFEVSVAEEPEMALARGAALASANAPLFASSTAALAYSLDPGTGEVHPRGLSPTYLDVSGGAAPDAGALAYSALNDEADSADDARHALRRRGPAVLVGGALAGIAAVAAGAVVVSLTSDVRPVQAPQPSPHAIAPQNVVPPPSAQPPAPSPPPPAPPPTPAVAAPAPEVAAPSPEPAPPPRRASTWRAPESVPTPVQQAAPPPQAPAPQQAPPPQQAPVPPPAAPPPAEAPARPPLTMYLHLPFVTVPIPINPPPPPPPPPAP